MNLNDSLRERLAKPSFILKVLIVCVALVGYGAYFGLTGRLSQFLGHRYEEPSEPAAVPMSRSLAYVDDSGALWVAPFTDAEPVCIMPGGRNCAMPTWAPNGRRLAFIAHDERGNLGVYVSPSDRGDPRLLFQRSATRPFYLYWSPDNSALAILSIDHRNGLDWFGERPPHEETVLRRVSVQEPSEVQVVAQGQPMYFAWSPDGDALLIHAKGALSVVDRQGKGQPRTIEDFSAAYTTPLWSADGDHVIFVRIPGAGLDAAGHASAHVLNAASTPSESNLGFSILSHDLATGRETQLDYVDGFGLLQMVRWKGGDTLVYRSSAGGPWNPSQSGSVPLRLFNAADKMTENISATRVYAVFWSPDGSNVALFAPEERDFLPIFPDWQGRRMRLLIYDVASKNTQEIYTFSPTQTFSTLLSHYEQFDLSHSLWSPDSRYVTVCGVGESGPTVLVVDTTQPNEARAFATGVLATWSWQ